MAKNNCRLFIYGIDENVSDSDLKAKFGEHGWITDTYNTGKGYAFVTFYHQSSADRAIKDFHGESLFGKRVKVEVATPRAGDEDKDDDERVNSEDEQRVDSEDEQRVDSEDERVDSEDSEDSEDSDDERANYSEEERVDSGDERIDDSEDIGDVMMGMMCDVEETMLRLNLTEVKWNGWLVKRE